MFFSRLFSVPHDIHRSYQERIKQFLVSRTRQVVTDNKYSGLIPATSIVRQGSVLRPLLLLYFINDLLSTIYFIYTDSVLMHRSIKDPSHHQALQNDLASPIHESLYNWY